MHSVQLFLSFQLRTKLWAQRFSVIKNLVAPIASQGIYSPSFLYPGSVLDSFFTGQEEPMFLQHQKGYENGVHLQMWSQAGKGLCGKKHSHVTIARSNQLLHSLDSSQKPCGMLQTKKHPGQGPTTGPDDPLATLWSFTLWGLNF